jgi:ubiquinol-cytochrome c reductase cytochrome b subunit
VSVTRRTVRFLDQRTGGAPLVRKALRYLFPDHWSFLLGEVALYAFIVLVGTGIYLTFFFVPSTTDTVYHGPYVPLQGEHMSEAYRSVVNISISVKAGLLLRQTHHWAANVFIASVLLHLFRVFFTGAFRKPRDLTYLIGVTMLFLALLEGFLGYSLVDDLLSGMGLAIAYSVALSIPFIGANVGSLIWHGPFPGGHEFFSRMYILHVLLLPVAIATLIAVHLTLVASRHHTQFRRSRRETEKTVVGVPTFPGQAPRSLALLLGVAGLLFLLGGLFQINPIWLWGPYHVGSSTNGAQPDWYLGWLIGGLRLMPGWDLVIGKYTLIPNAFWGGVLFPTVVLGFLYLYPALERRFTGEYGYYNLLDRPRDRPVRTAIGVGMITWVVLVFVAGSADRVTVLFDVSYSAQIWFYRFLVFLGPLAAAAIAYRACLELQRGERVERDREAAEDEARLAGGSV